MTDSAAAAGPWWRGAVVYQIYPRSFADGNGDGVGDIAGMRARLGHVRELGVDAVWVSPWCTSPMVDGGYDVSDHRDVDPRFGTLRDARGFVDDAHRLGLRVIIDLVANHCSDQHARFRAAVRAAPGSPERAWFHFHDGRGADGEQPPNNWKSLWGGPAWTRVLGPDGHPGQWYLHLFAPQQPDFDWAAPAVRDEFDDVMRFWFDLGVDGLRIDAASAFVKAEGLPDTEPELPDHGFAPHTVAGCPFWDQDGVHDLYRRWRAIADEYAPTTAGARMFVAESVTASPERLADCVRPGELHTTFNLELLKQPWDAGALRRVIDTTIAAHARVGAPPTWVLGSHDETRPATRYAPDDPELGVRRARAAALLLLALPGSAYVYQGEELGLPEVVDLPDGVLQDPVFARSGGAVRGRDGCRVPLPWTGESPPFGFTGGSSAPWLPQPLGWRPLTVEAQLADPGSVLSLYRAAIAHRAAAGLGRGDIALVWEPAPAGVLRFRRGEVVCVVNVDAAPYELPGQPLLVSEEISARTLPGSAAAWCRCPSLPGG